MPEPSIFGRFAVISPHVFVTFEYISPNRNEEKHMIPSPKSVGYLRFKKKLRRAALVKSLLFGISCGLLGASGAMLYQKLSTIPPSIALCLPIGTGLAIVISLVTFLVLRPSEKKIAYRLDRDLHLGEKVQTMLAYQHEESDMLTLQREDTDAHLLNAPKRAVKSRYAWLNVIAPLMAAACLTVAIMTPIRAIEPPPEEPEPPFELSSWQEIALTELIQKVRSSDMEAGPKKDTVTELEVLLAALKVTDKEADMKLMVIAVISHLNTIVREHNSANLVSPYLKASAHEDLQDMAMALDMLSGLEVEKSLTAAREALQVDEVAEPLQVYLEALNDLILKVSDVLPTDDAILSVLKHQQTSLSEIAKVLPEYTRDWAQKQISDIFEDTTEGMIDALYIQHTNKQVKDMAVKSLMDIFKISEDELPEEEKTQIPGEDEDPDESKKDEEEKGDQGAPGEGNILYGSDDVIFDPVTNTYVKYGEVINRYFAVVSDKLKEGQPPESLEQFISHYFATLYDGSEKEKAD